MMNIKNYFYFMTNLLKVLGVLMPVLLAVALLTLLERKVLGYMQFRKGPKIVGPVGTLQPFADGLKLFVKENFKPSSANSLLYYVSPSLFFFIAMVLWGAVPLKESGMNFSLSLLFFMSLSSLSVYGVLGAGWSSNSKYSLLGSVRAVAQVISYEVSFGLILLPMVLMVGGWGLFHFVDFQEKGVWLIFPCFPLFLMWYMSSLAETNRTPFDLSEGESELVSGYNVEYSGAPFALFFMGEYANIILIKLITVILFFGSGSPLFNFWFNIFFLMVKVFFLIFSFLWVRASFPRVRYDQLMMLMWKNFLPLTISFFFFFFYMGIFFYNFPCYY